MSLLFEDGRSIEEAVGRFDPTKHPRGRGGKFRDVLGMLERMSPGSSQHIAGHQITRGTGRREHVYTRGFRGKQLNAAPASEMAGLISGTKPERGMHVGEVLRSQRGAPAPGGERPMKRAEQVADIKKRVKSPAHKFAVSERGKKLRDIRGPRPGTPEAAESRRESAATARARAAELRAQGNEEHARDYDEMAARFERGAASPGGERPDPGSRLRDVKTGEVTPVTSEQLHHVWNTRGSGIEGPFTYPSGWKGYYDPKAGRYLGMDDVYMPRHFDPHSGLGAHERGMERPGGERLDGDALVHNEEVRDWFEKHGDSGESAEALAEKIHAEEYAYAYRSYYDYDEGDDPDYTENIDWQVDQERDANIAGIKAAIARVRAQQKQPGSKMSRRSGYDLLTEGSLLFADGKSIEEAVGSLRFDPTKHPRGRGGKFRDVLGMLSPGGERGPNPLSSSSRERGLAQIESQRRTDRPRIRPEDKKAYAEREGLAQELAGPGQMKISVSDRPSAPWGYREQFGGLQAGDKVRLPDGREGTVQGPAHARGGEQHYLVHTPRGKVGSKAWKDEQVLHDGKFVKRSTAVETVRKRAQERFKGLDNADEYVQREVDKYLAGWEHRGEGMEQATLPLSKLRFTGEEFAARVERAQDLARKAEKPPKTPAVRPAARPVTLRANIVPHEWAIEHGYNIGGLHWKSENTEAMIYHFLTGKRPTEKYPKGTKGHEQWSYKGGKNKADREAIIRKITQALDAREAEDFEEYARLLEEACLLVSEFGPLDLEEAAAVATLARWDPSKHPRGRGGMFRDVLTMLRSNGSHNLGQGVHVRRTAFGFRVRGPRGGSKFHFDETNAVDHAVELHSEAVRKDLLGVHGGRPFFAHTRAPGGERVLDPEWMIAHGREREERAAATRHQFPQPGEREGTRVHLGMGNYYDLKDEPTARQVADQARTARQVGGVAMVQLKPGMATPGGERRRGMARPGGDPWYDPELPAGFQSADLEMRDLEIEGTRRYRIRQEIAGLRKQLDAIGHRNEDDEFDALQVAMRIEKLTNQLPEWERGMASPGGERGGGEKNARKIERMKGDSIRFGAMTVRREEGGTYSVETNRGESLGTGLTALDASRAVSAQFQRSQSRPSTSVLEPGTRGVLSPSYAYGMGAPGGERISGGLHISAEALNQIGANAERTSPEQAVDDYIARMSERWGAPWDVIRPDLVRLVTERTDPNRAFPSLRPMAETLDGQHVQVTGVSRDYNGELTGASVQIPVGSPIKRGDMVSFSGRPFQVWDISSSVEPGKSVAHLSPRPLGMASPGGERGVPGTYTPPTRGYYTTLAGTTVLHPGAAELARVMERLISGDNPPGEYTTYGRINHPQFSAEPPDPLLVKPADSVSDAAHVVNLTTGQRALLPWDVLAHKAKPKERMVMMSPGGERRGRSGMPVWKGDRLEGLRKIVDEHQAHEIDGHLVDAQTAQLLLKVHDALNPKNRATFGSVPLPKLVDLAWRVAS